MIDFGVTIPNKIVCMPNTLYVEKIEYGERKTKNGIILMKEQMDHYGNFTHPRWAKVLYKADNIDNINVGDWILMKHGHWSISMLMEIHNEPKKLWYISPKSYFEGVMGVSHTMPEYLKEYGIEED